ncbi:uncharacterized protein P884DRAFT_250652 [Thermothelomyces heterothallicus CBS 202.75]|uniref:uncharacterized protein n=1 Tax=Thermothelomyces heterothallicus CBS 202.75 TaxID=1149848 RepID=UPI003743FDB5
MASEDKTSPELREGDPTAPAKIGNPNVLSENAAKSAVDEPKPIDRSVASEVPSSEKKATSKHSKRRSRRPKKKQSPAAFSSDSDASVNATVTGSSSSDAIQSEVETPNKKKVSKKHQGPPKAKKTRANRHRKTSTARKTPDSDSNSESESDSEFGSSKSDGGGSGQDDEERQQAQANLVRQLQHLLLFQQQQQPQQLQKPQGAGSYGYPSGLNNSVPAPIYDTRLRYDPARPRHGGAHPSGWGNLNLGTFDSNLLLGGTQDIDTKKARKATRLEYKRVDQVWDDTIHNYKLQDTAEGKVNAQYDEFIFHVRRTFDWEGKYKATIVDIKSKLLRECLQDVIGDIKGVSLVDDTPKVDPNLLFLYLEDLRKHLKDLKKKARESKIRNKHDRKKEIKRIESKRQHLKVLIKYIDKDSADIKNSLYPMLENGLITFELLWALWKPNTLAYTTTYGSHEEPRVFKVEVAEKHHNIMRGDSYYLEGKYFEYDGKQHGFGSISEVIGEFRGARKITSLGCYPLKYHRNEARLRKELIERGKKFVSLSGVHYKSHQGMAYYKKKKTVVKININGRIMIDPSVHRRTNPNYPISLVKPKDHDMFSGDEDEDDDDKDDVDSVGESGCCGCDADHGDDASLSGEKVRFVTKAVQDDKGKVRYIRVPRPEGGDDDDGEGGGKERLGMVISKGEDGQRQQGTDGDPEKTPPSEDGKAAKPVPEFSDEEYLIASPVVLGFAFAEKLWLEFTVSGVKEIQWNETAYESLVLEPKTKDIVKALVESHKYHAAESIDDVIQGKGKGLVAVLHGPPGTGKTLTAEGISELLKCPLYMASAGELGTDSRYLESELQKILDICHAWGAILLLDEADVFLEKRNMRDIHRNALVSVFLRQLEYFQGILFLTTNRVETFDDAFQSRIHIALRYDELDHRARKTIFKIFIERARVLEKASLMAFSEEDYATLARHELNGRQIKNTVRTAQALAVNKGEPLSMSHIRQVLEVQTNFERDLKGGPGYQEAMRSYF